MNLQEIKAEVQRRADGEFPNLVIQLFDKVKKEHVHQNGLYGIGCHCDYCQALSRYVMTKMSAQRLKRRIEHSEYENDVLWGTSVWGQVQSRFAEAVELRSIKNQILQESEI